MQQSGLPATVVMQSTIDVSCKLTKPTWKKFTTKLVIAYLDSKSDFKEGFKWTDWNSPWVRAWSPSITCIYQL